MLDGIPSRLEDKLMEPHFPIQNPDQPSVIFFLHIFLADLKQKIKYTNKP